MFVCKVRTRNYATHSWLGRNWDGAQTVLRSRPTRATDRDWAPVYNCAEEDETRAPLQKAIDDAGYIDSTCLSVEGAHRNLNGDLNARTHRNLTSVRTAT